MLKLLSVIKETIFMGRSWCMGKGSAGGQIGGAWVGAVQKQELRTWARDKVMARLMGMGSGRRARMRLRGMGRSSEGARLRGMGGGSIGASLRVMGRGSPRVRFWGMGRGSAGARLRGMGRGNDAKTALRVIKETK